MNDDYEDEMYEDEMWGEDNEEDEEDEYWAGVEREYQADKSESRGEGNSITQREFDKGVDAMLFFIFFPLLD